ncbi:MAG: GAF domain-containing protein [Lysobacterales bacterium]|jgi:GAF domain-containing protein
MTGSQQLSWNRLVQQAEGLLCVSSNRISNAANLSALLFQELADISWVGFYFLYDKTLMLGPFQGKPACVSIPMGIGVCGTAAACGETMRVADVETFDGHIVCDAQARSEIVVPLFKRGELLGVLDVDSARLDRFSEEDEVGLKTLAQVYLSSIE